MLQRQLDDEGRPLAGQRLDQALAKLAGVPRAQAQRWIEAGAPVATVERGAI